MVQIIHKIADSGMITIVDGLKTKTKIQNPEKLNVCAGFMSNTVLSM